MINSRMQYARRWLQTHDNVISTAQARAMGLSHGDIRGLIERGEWTRVRRGIYRTTSIRTSHRETLSAAIAAAGKDAAASHLSAAWVLGLVAHPPSRPHLVVPATKHPRSPGIRIHRCNGEIPARQVKGIRCTTPVRTLLDIAATRPSAELADVVDRAISLGLVTVAQLVSVTDPGRQPRQRGVAALRRHLRERGDLGVPTPSLLE